MEQIVDSQKNSKFHPEDFKEVVCRGEMPKILERLAETANHILETRIRVPSTKYTDGTQDMIEICDQLRILNSKLRAVGYLIEVQDSEQVRPQDMDQINLGLSSILNGICSGYGKMADKIESSFGKPQ